jgi:hypothetical protein
VQADVTHRDGSKPRSIEEQVEHAATVDDVCFGRLITLRQIGLQKLKPNAFAGITLGSWMPEGPARGAKPLLGPAISTMRLISGWRGKGARHVKYTIVVA